MRSRKAILSVSALCLAAALLFGVPPQAQAAGVQPRRFIAIVYDDSGSMRYLNHKDTLKNYIYANYSLQNLVALMDSSDSAQVFLISRQGKNPISVSRQKDLNKEFQGVGAVTKGDTYAETIDAAFQAGSAFLKSNTDGEFLFVMMTDGATMNDAKSHEIPDAQLSGWFNTYISKNNLSTYSARTRALLLSIGTAKPLAPVSKLATALDDSGIYTQTFVADVTGGTSAGAHIMASMNELAEAMASTNKMEIEPGKPFTIRYPLQSLVLMEQFQQSSESMVKSITGSDGTTLKRSTIYSTKAIDGMKLASTFSTIKSSTGYVKPGQYTIASSGKVTLMAFSKVGFTESVAITDEQGTEVAEYKDNQWSKSGISIAPGSKLTAKVALVALDGTSVQIGSYVSLGFGAQKDFICTATGQGSFQIQGTKAGQDYLNISLADPEYFQLAIPALGIQIQDKSQPQPSASPSTQASAAPSVTAAAGSPSPNTQASPSATFYIPDIAPFFSWSALESISKQSFPVEFTSAATYTKVAEFTITGKREGKQKASITAPIPKGLQIRINGVTFDSKSASGDVDIMANNTVEIFSDSEFSAPAQLALPVQFESGEILTVNIAPKPRALKIETEPGKLSFGVLDGKASIPGCTYKVMIEQDGKWSEVKATDIPIIKVLEPGGFSQSDDLKAQILSIYPGWLPVLTPVGASTVTLHVGTGKPGETADGSIDVSVHDDWRKWLYLLLVVAAIVLASVYAVLIVLKKRIPMEMEATVSDNGDMAVAISVEISRNLSKRNFWPFGREVCTLGLLELYPNPKSFSSVLLSNVAVQYGLRLDGKPPQFHKNRDEEGDYIINADNVIGVRVEGAYLYYRIEYKGTKVQKPAKQRRAPRQ